MPKVHPTEELLNDYAAGTLSEGVSLAIATHIAMCPQCRGHVSELEAIGGSMLFSAVETPVGSQVLENVLAQLEDIQGVSDAKPSLPRDLKNQDIILPNPLRDYLGAKTLRELDHLNWTNLPGYSEYVASDRSDKTKVRLLRVAAGMTLPQHTHEGLELTLILKGSFSDHNGTCGVGDLSVADPATDHAPSVDRTGECICLAVTDAPLRLTGRFGRMLNPFLDL
ncbi:ChrR family anti-sigma-E factor [Parvularcula sp. IMCC14364]|uniref:ChrR family anti-sigma-E factor n=1 Tax=Parvularcula sp. IMCC14364 TaxID=3067902 RepID=UPI0027407028|nr:ChrR family anti-sigma-E factor [Parvularcula sp. IMCC14364]